MILRNKRHYCFLLLFIFLLALLPFAPAAQKLSAGQYNDPRLSPLLQTQLPVQNGLALVIKVKGIAAFRNYVSAGKLQVEMTKVYADDQAILLNCSRACLLDTLLTYPGLLFVDLQRKAIEESSIESVDLSLNTVNLAQYRFPLLNGNNQLVSVKEHRFDTADIDFKGRMRLFAGTSATLSSHATAMTTIIGGAGNSFYKGRGVAPGAMLNSTTFLNLLPEADTFYTNQKVMVQNHSYGTGIENYYGIDAEAHDRSMRSNPSLLHVFSAGNSGLSAATTGTYQNMPGFANLTSNAKMAKNLITVGATDSFGIAAPLSSKGPAYDGRVKPEMVAMGEDGSSGAAAMVSGAAALVQQAWQLNNGGASANAAIVKAVLLNSAAETGPAGIDFSTGYGQLDLNRSLQTIADNRIITGSLAQGQTAAHSITLPPNVLLLKATITWTDLPAAASAAKALVNDLDLSVQTPSAQEILPWVLSSFPHPDSLRKLPVRRLDTLNNTEQVTISNPAAGTYTLKVNGRKIPNGTQDYAIAWSYDTLALQWIFPQRDDAVIAGARNLLRWQTTATTPLTIEYTLNGSNWISIADNIPASPGYRYWLAPDTFALAILRIRTGTLVVQTDTIVTSKPIDIKVGFNCPDSFLFTWKPYGPGRYKAWRLGSRYMESLAVLTDTVLSLSKAANPALDYAISPLLANNRSGIRSFTTNYTTQGTECYFKTFTAFLNNAVAEVVAELATGYRVRQTRIIRLNNSTTISSFTPASGLLYTVADNALTPGINRYQAEVELLDGRKIRSRYEDVYFAGGKTVYVFPTPVQRGQPLNIVTSEQGTGRFSLYDGLGRKVLDKRIVTTQESINTLNLPRGLYFFRLLPDTGKAVSGRVVVE